MLHKRKDGSYIHDDAQVVGEKIMNIENEDGSFKEFSQNDSLAQALGKGHTGRVRGFGTRPCPTQRFGQTHGVMSSHAPTNHIIQSEVKEMKSEVNEVKSQLEDERQKRRDLEAMLEAERLRRQTFEGVVKYILQMQGGNLPPDLAALINTTDLDERSEPTSPCVRKSSAASHEAHQFEQSGN